MKPTKHILLTIAMLLCSITASAYDFEVGGIYYNITSDTDLTVEITYEKYVNYSYSSPYSGNVVIPESVTYNSETYQVTSIGKFAFEGCSSLTSITIPESVTSIGHYAFSDCSSLTAINIPEGVTSIGGYAFEGCSSLTAINIPEGVTSIGGYAFNGTPWYDNQPDGVIYVGKVLYEYKGKMPANTSIEVREGTVSISPFAFNGCGNLTSITILDGVTSIGVWAFSDCSSLTSITLPESVTSIGGYAFMDCSSLTSITLPEGVTSIEDGAFYECSSLTSITIPEGVTSIGEDAFSGTAWYDNQPDGVIYAGRVLYEYKGKMPANTSIEVREGTVSISPFAFWNCRSLTSITLPEGVTSIGYGAFSDCSSLTSITIPESVTSIGDYAFYNCSSLTSITCEAVNPPTTQYGTFEGVNKSIPLYVPRASISAYQAASYWQNFTNIQAIPTPENITLTIGQYGSGTYCSEYALDFSEVEGLKAYVAAGYNSETGVVTLLRVMSAKAGVGLFVKGEPGDYVVPVLENTSYNALNLLVGTLEETTVNSTDGSYTNYKYTIREGDAEPMFYPFADGSTQGAGRAYLQIPTAWLTEATAKSISYRFDEGDGTTDVEFSTLNSQPSTEVYDLMGRRVANPTKGGIYIVNGKKVIR